MPVVTIIASNGDTIDLEANLNSQLSYSDIDDESATLGDAGMAVLEVPEGISFSSESSTSRYGGTQELDRTFIVKYPTKKKTSLESSDNLNLNISDIPEVVTIPVVFLR